MTRAGGLSGLLLASALAFGAGAATAQSFAVVGATVHTAGPAGTLEGATVVVRDGKIAAVGADVDVPAGLEVVAADGRPLTPGLFDTANQIGLVEVSAVDGTVDGETELARYAAAFDVAPAINPRSTLVPANRIEGLTRSLVVPGSSTHPIAGLGAVIHLGPGDDTVVRPRAVLVVDLGETGADRAGGSRAAALLRLAEVLDDARDHAAHREAFRAGDRYPYARPRLDLEALAPVLERRTPVLVRVERASDIESLLDFAGRQEIDVVVLGGSEAWMVAGRLAEAGVPVVLDPLSNLPESFETLGATLENAARLAAAGVRIAFTAGSSHNARNLTQAAGNAVAHGLPWEAALRAVTATPAALWGLGDTVGTVEVGRDADLVLWDGDPLEVTTMADRVWIRGRDAGSTSRSTLLRDRYRHLPPDRPPAWIRPETAGGGP